MISARFRHVTERFVRSVACVLPVKDPNKVTIISLIPAFIAFYYFYMGDMLLGGIFTLVTALFDSLDGAVARCNNRVSKRGSYLDAIIDRYVEFMLLLGIALGTGYYVEVMFILFGSLLTSYAKARASMEVSVDNINWPDLMERAERMLYIGIIIPISSLYGLLRDVLVLLAVLTNITAIQRIIRALRRIENESVQ